MSRHLLVAAALREVLATEPIVVGGTAQDLYTGEAYVQTDLDVCGWLSDEEQRLLTEELGFVEEGRHFFHEASKVAVEFPESRIDGDESRILRTPIADGLAAIIGVEDLYVDRVRQATATPDDESLSSRSALAIALAAYDEIDWEYVANRIEDTERTDPHLGRPMRRIHKRVRRKMLAAIRDS